MAWVFLRHPGVGGVQLAAEGAVEALEARGWIRHDMPAGLDPDDPHAPWSLAEVLAEQVAPTAAEQSDTEPEPAKPEPKKPSKAASSATEKKE